MPWELHQPRSERLVPGADRQEERDKGRDNFGGERRAVGRVCGQVTGSSQRKDIQLDIWNRNFPQSNTFN